MTREEWLENIVDAARPLFEEAGTPLPENVRVSIGLPSGRKAVGECWHSVCSEDGGREIFVSPVLKERGDVRIASVLIHELCHAALPDGTGHNAPFRKLGEKLLLEGKPTEMEGGEEFEKHWVPIVEKIGPYPGAGFTKGAGTLGNGKKQTTRMIKVQCTDAACGMIFRTSQPWIEKGTLSCPLCGAGTLVG